MGKLKDEINEDEEIKLAREEDAKYFPILFAFIISTIAIIYYAHNFLTSDLPFRATLTGATVAVAFLVSWVLCGIVMGYKKKIHFMKFITFYWGIGSLIYLIGQWVSTTRFSVLNLLMIPFHLLFEIPTYGLRYYYGDIIFLNIILSWSAGAIGFLLGYLLNELRVRMLPNK